MDISKSISNDNLKMHFKLFNYINDRCEVRYINSSSSGEGVTDKFTIAGNEYTEDRYLPSKWSETAFDVREYVGRVENEWKDRMALYGASLLATWKTALLTNIEETTDTSESKAVPMYFLNGSNVRNEKMCATRVHLYNPHFPHIVEWMPIVGSNKKATVQMRYNYDEPDIYERYVDSTDKFPTAQLLLNKFTDDRYNEEGVMLYVTFPNHLEPSNEVNNTYSDIDALVDDLSNIVNHCTSTRVDAYIYDTRTKGVFLRFIDRFGFIQQILLTISTRETSISSGDAIQTYQGQQVGYEDHVCGGSGLSSNKAMAETIHCGLQGVRKELVGDITDLLMSPKVYMYRGGFNDSTNDDTECYWEEVNVASSGITLNEKKATMDASIDVTITSRNGYAI